MNLVCCKCEKQFNGDFSTTDKDGNPVCDECKPKSDNQDKKDMGAFI